MKVLISLAFFLYVGILRVSPFIRKDWWVTNDGPDTEYDDAQDRQKIEHTKKKKRIGWGRE